MEPKLAGSIYVRSSIKYLRFVPFGQQIWLLRAILVSDWLMLKKSSPLKLLGQIKPNLAGSIYVRSSIKPFHLVPFGQQTWPPRTILFSDWLMLKKSSPLKLLGQMVPNFTGSIYVRSSIKFLRFVLFGEHMAAESNSCYGSMTSSNLHHIFMSRSVSQLLLEIYHLYLFYTYIVRCTCQSARCHLTLTSFSRPVTCITFS